MRDGAPSVSVVINTYNRADSLSLTLQALEHLDYPRFEVVVVNGPSTDDTDTVLAQNEGRIVVARCEERNLSMSRNIGIRAAAGEIIAFIDDDAYPDPAWLDEVTNCFDDDEVAAAGGPAYNHTGIELQARYSVATRAGKPYDVVEGPNLTRHLNSPWGRSFMYTIGTNALFRRDRLVSIGGFDEEYEYHLDDTDVCCRLVDRGWVVAASDRGFVYHKYLSNAVRSENRAIQSRFPAIKNHTYFALRHGRPSHSFAEIVDTLHGIIDLHRNELNGHVHHGLVDPEVRDQFERDVHDASNAGFEAWLRDAPRTKDPEWFDTGPREFTPFPTRQPQGRKLHVCLLTQEYPPRRLNGIARYVNALATGLATPGHIVRVLTESDGEDTVDFEDRVWVHRIAVKPHPQDGPLPGGPVMPQALWNRSATMLDELKRIHATRPVDLVQAPNWDSEGAAIIADGEFPVVVGLYTPMATVRRLDPTLNAGQADLDDIIATERWCYQRAPHLLANGPTVVSEIEDAYGVRLNPERQASVSLGLPDLTEGVVPLRSRPDGVEMLFLGRLERRKGIDTLLDAIPAVLEKVPDVHFVVVGRDDLPADPDGTTYRQRFEASVSPEILQRVRFTGNVSDEERLARYAACDVFVAPSRFESFGLILVEAMMFAKPVVAGDISAMAAIVGPDGSGEEAGRVVDPDDPVALSTAIVELASSPELRRQLGSNGRRRFEDRYSAERMVAETEAAYRRWVG